MKKIYSKPEIDITAFTTEDIITASNNPITLSDETDNTGNTLDLSKATWYNGEG